jgi:hypothetical protein
MKTKIPIHKQLILESSFKNIPCNGIQDVNGKHYGFSCGKENKSDNVFIYTHRARSKAYSDLNKIPLFAKKFIDSTG